MCVAIPAACVFSLAPSPLAAAQSVAIDIPAGPLTGSLATLARQAGISIGSAETVPHRSARRVRGRLPVAAALRRLLDGTGWQATEVAPRVWRIALAPVRRPRPPAPVATMPQRPVAPPAIGDIVVTATKRAERVADVAMPIAVLGAAAIDDADVRDTASVGRSINGLFATNLGTGRDRLFIRGVADGPFDGFAQSSVAVYLGGTRATYDAPDPGLRLFDMRQVEVLKGPQGPLYGSGALGGVYQMVPMPPDLRATSASLRSSMGAVRDGGMSATIDGVVNLPVMPGRLGLRLVAYLDRAPGWIDEAGRRDINRGLTAGGRLAVAGRLGAWRIDAIGTVQASHRADSHYVEQRGARDRDARLPEPQDTDFGAAGVSATGPVGAMIATLAASGAWQELAVDYDASSRAAALGLAGAVLYRDDRRYRVLNGEARLAGTIGAIDWLAGASLLDASTRATGIAHSGDGASKGILSVDRRVREQALFGEVTVPVAQRLTGTVGWRMFAAQVADDRRTRGDDRGYADTTVRASPSASLAWRGERTIIYARLASALRPGGVQSSSRDFAAGRYEADELIESDLGARWRSADDRWSVDASAFGSLWSHVQADTLTDAGLVTTYNAGNARNRGVDVSVHWAASGGVSLTAGLLAQHARIHATALAIGPDRRLPVVPDLAIHGEAGWAGQMGAWRLTARLAARYTGEARLSFDPALDRESEAAVVATASLGAAHGPWSTRLTIDNFIDSRADTFSFGNPFSVAAVPQFTPLRPRSATLALQRRF